MVIRRLNVPTKTEDGGSTNEQEEETHINQDQGEGEVEETTSTSTSTRPDAFRTYSDNDTRMLTLLGLEPSANPNDGEQEDWRQLTGFTGIGEERRCRNDEDGTTPRRTRLSTELHLNAFENTWLRNGELNMDHDHDGGQPPPPRQQQDDRQQQREEEGQVNEEEQQQQQG